MEEKDLQINRWYELNGLPVRAINLEGLNTLANELKYLKGIELTEEILLKCGFERSDNDLFELKVNANIDIWFRTERTLYANIDTYDENIEDTSSTSFSHIKTLHQLQNLYFALTNEELTINL